MNIKAEIVVFDWENIRQELNTRGFAVIPKFLPSEICQEFITNYDQPGLYRKTIVMERYRFGQGEYKYFSYPLPYLIQTIREEVYPYLAPIANNWMNQLIIDRQFPETFFELQSLCHAHNQTKPTPLILRYETGGFNTLHQDLYGEIFFPLQMALFLNEPGEDYTGGEFVLTEQTPRAQSKAIVLKPRKGDLLIFTTNFRPAKGARGFYRLNMKHGVSQINSGKRHTLGIIFHDALT